ncbi:hypothetical protein IWQ60_011305 [Tieghemiomyces parasiticus]|uniref:Uncharacterized protein n=1 Tax=Tieghemiomyces parasiticus TaxID=78921 RepID=A0A9W7ZNJ4_9FUNG|nr:hypothetical protein IWQ60_011305 [Tieghemiomyces parasiticus]
MKTVTAVLALAALAALATAQDDFEMCPQCAVDDVGCRARCMGVPNPNAATVSNTNECFNKCTVRDPTAANTCMQNCISQVFNPSNGAPPVSHNHPGKTPKSAASSPSAEGAAMPAEGDEGSAAMPNAMPAAMPASAGPSATSAPAAGSTGAWGSGNKSGSSWSSTKAYGASSSKSGGAKPTNAEDNDSGASTVAVSGLVSSVVVALVVKNML